MQEQGQLELNIILDSLLTILSQCYVIKEIFYMFKRDLISFKSKRGEEKPKDLGM